MGARLFRNWWIVFMKGIVLAILPILPMSQIFFGISSVTVILLFISILSISSSLFHSLPPRYTVWHFEALFEVSLLILSIFLTGSLESYLFMLWFLGYSISFGFTSKLVVELRQFLSFAASSFMIVAILLLLLSISAYFSVNQGMQISNKNINSNLIEIYYHILPKFSSVLIVIMGITFTYIGIRLKMISVTQQHLIRR